MSVLDRFRLKGRRALVTGGTRGLGFEMAKAVAEAGAELVLVGRTQEHLDEAAGKLEGIAPKLITLHYDIGTPAAATAMCEEALAKHGPIDIVINNVGGRRVNFPTEEMPLEEWQKIVDLNLTQIFICTKLLGGAMLERGHGRVINVASISGFVAGSHMRGRSYETCKAAVAMFTKSVAADWAKSGVTVNAIAPGTYLTDANKRWFSEQPELKLEIEGMIPMGRLGDPEEIGPLAVYLASDASSYMTGSVIVIDGGRLLW